MKWLFIIYNGYKINKYLLNDGDELNISDMHLYYKNGWYLEVSNGLRFKDNSLFKELKERVYEMVKDDIYFTIYVEFLKWSNDFIVYKRKDLLISNHKKADINILDERLLNRFIFLKDDYLKGDIENVYVNNKKYKGQKLNSNDRIDIYQLVIFYTKDLLIISDFNNLINLELYNFEYHQYHDEYCNIQKSYNLEIAKPELKYSIKLEENKEINETPFLITFGQGIFLSLGMLVLAIANAYISYLNKREIYEIIIIVMMPLLMALASILFPLIQKSYNKKKNLKDINIINKINNEKIKTLENKIQDDFSNLKKYYDYYRFNYENYLKIIKDKSLYYRSFSDEKFLKISIAKGNVLSKIIINNEYHNNYSDKTINTLLEKYKHLKDVPYIIDLNLDDYITIKIDKLSQERIFLYILIQIYLSHDYNDLKIALFINEDFILRYPFIKEIPHLYHEGNRLIFYEESDLKIDNEVLILSMHEVVVNNDHKVIHFTNHIIPKKTKLLIEYQNHQFHINGESYFSNEFIFDLSIFYKLRKYRLDIFKYHQDDITLKDIYPLDLSLDKSYQTQTNLSFIAGIDENKKIIKLDISEKGIGPHGLIGGSTGSGKSEFIISLIISMCLNYSAKSLNIALIDYKGSGLIEALSYKGIKLPHIVLSLSNLDKVALNRSLAFFKLECHQRELLFAKLAKLTSSSIMNLEDYHRLNPEKYGLPYLANELIIIDEFAELKRERPDFMKDIISIARIGRSLGLLLILITQKPTSVVDQEIWANTAYKIALRMQDDIDSKELIKSDLAAKIKKPGEFYLSNKDKLIHGFGIYSRSLIDSRNHEMVDILDINLKKINSKEFITDNEERQLSHYVKKIINYHNINKIKTNSIYLDKLKESSFIDLYQKYHINLNDDDILLGEYDDYNNMIQRPLIHNLKIYPYVIASYIDNNKRHKWFNIFLLSLSFKAYNYHIIYIGDSHTSFNKFDDIIEKVAYENTYDIEYILNKIINYNDFKIVLMIEDYTRFMQNEKLKELFEKVLSLKLNTNLYVIIASLNKINLSFKLDNIFTKYVLDYKTSDSLLYAFNMMEDVSEESVFKKDNHLIGFKLVVANDIKTSIKKNTYFINKIPEIIKAEINMLGYNIIRRNKVYIKNKKVLICAYYKEILNNYKKIFKFNGDFEFSLFNEIDKEKYYEVIVWLGPNLLNQFIFIPKIKRDLNPDEAYIHYGIEYEVIKCVNR